MKTEEIRDKVADAFVQIHNSVIKVASEDYLSERGRHVYITPTRFTETFGLFEKIMMRKTK